MFNQVVAPRTEKLVYCQRVLENELLTITACELQQLRKACTHLKAGQGDANGALAKQMAHEIAGIF